MATNDDDLAHGLSEAARYENERSADPYAHSALAEYVELDTWATEEALLLLAGVAPKGADLKSSYENLADVTIREPRLVNAQLLAESEYFYLIPWQFGDSGDDAMTPTERSEVEEKRSKLKDAERRYRRIMRMWESDPKHAFLARDLPEAYVAWAESKNIEVSWREWFVNNRARHGSAREQVPAESKPGFLTVRAEATFLNIIGGLLGLMLGKTPAGQRQSVFENQSAVIDALIAHYGGKPGIAQRTLEEKFAKAKRAIDSD